MARLGFVCILLTLLQTTGICFGDTRDMSFVMARSKQGNAMPFRRFRRTTSSEATIEKFHVLSFVTSRYSKAVVVSVVRNNAPIAQEVSVVLRLPKSAFISNFSMEIDSVTYVGIVDEKNKARKRYNQAVAQGQSAGLVTADERDSQTFDVSVNVESGGVVTFKLDYQELLKRTLGVYNHEIYVNPGQIVEDLKIEVHISEPSGIESIEAHPPMPDGKGRGRYKPRIPDNEGLIVRRSGSQAYVIYEPSVEKQRSLQRSDVTFTVTYDVTREELGGEILIKDGYFVHFFAPTDLPVIPKNVVFVIDQSGSMSGRKIRQTKEALDVILDDLADHDKFNLITFNSRAHTWQNNEMLDVNPDNIRNAKNFVSRIYANGGTNLFDATMQAVSLLELITRNQTNTLKEASMIILLTDGQPTSGPVTNTEQIRSIVKKRIAGKYSLFCLGFGNDVDHTFLEKLALENKGLSRRIYVDADSSLQLKNFYDEVASPLLAHVIVRYGGTPVSNLTKTQFDNFFDGAEFLIAGQIDTVGIPDSREPGLIGVVEGESVGGKLMLTSRGKKFERTFSKDGFDMEKLWAYLTIKDLLKNKTETADNKDVVSEIDSKVLQLSLKYNFVTPLTSLVVTKPDGDAIPPPPKPTPTYPIPFPRPPLPYGTYGNVQARRLLQPQSPGRSLSLQSLPAYSYFGYGGGRIVGGRAIAAATTSPIYTTTTSWQPPPTETPAPSRKPIPADPFELKTSCGENIILQSAKNISSPRFPGLYPENSQCIWQITLLDEFGSGGEIERTDPKMRLTFSKLDLEDACFRDRILVYSDFDKKNMTSSDVVELCGYETLTSSFEAKKNFVLLFQSDDVVQGRGFLAHLQVV
ncbi:unnamed protein product [Clavelina lepadiformis]|uniref:Inter-alpha-trypsin inhibitor heavy chain H4 n=1 Tax=Clavelina lepadiformis TaxID=159417 RepID=A0ABP0FE66_CLALP